MPEGTLRLPVRPQSPPPPRRRRRRPSAGTVVVLIIVGSLVAAVVVVWAWWSGSVGSLPVRDHCTATASGRTAELDPDQAGNAAIIASIAGDRGLPGRAASIGIATAIQESKLRNIDYGDRDSLGLFQQRPSQGWGTKQQILDPVYATNAFYDVLAKIEGFENLPITKVAQKVQKSAFPDAYADHEPEARIMASALTGYSPGGFSCVLKPAATTAQAAGTGGLTPRARALQKAATRETGAKVVTADGRGGTAVSFLVEGRRAGWGVASWAVARAGALNVVEVQVGDKTWRRSASTEGWQSNGRSAAVNSSGVDSVLVVVS